MFIPVEQSVWYMWLWCCTSVFNQFFVVFVDVHNRLHEFLCDML